MFTYDFVVFGCCLDIRYSIRIAIRRRNAHKKYVVLLCLLDTTVVNDTNLKEASRSKPC